MATEQAMTRPRARPKPGLMFAVLGPDGFVDAVARDRASADRYALTGHTIVECVPMPRVTFRRLPENEDAWEKFVVSVNGVDVIWFDFAMDAHRAARDLRRALRGK